MSSNKGDQLTPQQQPGDQTSSCFLLTRNCLKGTNPVETWAFPKPRKRRLFALCFHGSFSSMSSPVLSSSTWCLRDLGKHGRREKYILNPSHKPVQKVGMEAISDDARVKLSICSGSFREGNWHGRNFLVTLIRNCNVLTRSVIISAAISPASQQIQGCCSVVCARRHRLYS